MQPPSEDVERRRAVWDSLSEFFLDTELDDEDLNRIAKTLAPSKYSGEELTRILYEEVYPVCIPNLSVGIGEWQGFDPEWIQKEILKNEKKPWKKWKFFR